VISVPNLVHVAENNLRQRIYDVKKLEYKPQQQNYLVGRREDVETDYGSRVQEYASKSNPAQFKIITSYKTPPTITPYRLYSCSLQYLEE
jgi:hypothetical protein